MFGSHMDMNFDLFKFSTILFHYFHGATITIHMIGIEVVILKRVLEAKQNTRIIFLGIQNYSLGGHGNNFPTSNGNMKLFIFLLNSQF